MKSVSILQLIQEKNVAELEKVLSPLSGFEIYDIMAGKSEEEQVLIFSVLPPKLAAETFDYLPLRAQKKILSSLSSSLAASILTAMPPDDRTALLQELPRPVIDDYLKLLPVQERNLAVMLLGYPEDSVGRIMTTNYIAVKMDWAIEQVFDQIRDYGHDSETINEIYVVDDNDLLLGEIKLKDLLFFPKDYKVSQIVQQKFVALCTLDKAVMAINIFKKSNRIVLPVVDEDGLLDGIVTIDDILRLASEKNTENIQKIGGTEALDAPYMETPFFELMKKRARWLVIIFVGELFTASAMGFFEDEISKAVVLALFLPLIISSGGNAGSQSTTLIIRALALGEVKIKDWFKIMKREILSGIFLGTVLGIIGFLRVSLWSTFSDIYGEHWGLVALTVSLALICVVLWGSLAGSMLPLLLRRGGFDPAVASAPLVATLVDVTGILFYFWIAMWILKGALL